MDKKRRIRELRKIVDGSKLVGDCEDVLPYAWKNPPQYDGLKCSKVVQQLRQEEYVRTHPQLSKKN